MRRMGVIVGILLGTPLLMAQSISLPFHEADSLRNLDWTSYPGMMMLKHRSGAFFKLPKNPIFRPSRSGWDRQDVADPFVVVTPEAVHLYYDGDARGQYRLGVARLDSTGWFWIRPLQPLPIQSPQNWDDYHQVAPSVLMHPHRTVMYFSGNWQDSELGYRLGRAVFVNGEWRVEPPSPILEPTAGGWDGDGTAYAFVMYDPIRRTYRMYYTGFQGVFSAIGLVESSDGVRWQAGEANPIFSSPPGVIAPFVQFDGDTYWMYYVQLELTRGFRTSIFRVQSADGIRWHSPEKILKPEARWEGGRLMRPVLAFFDQRIHLFYCAQRGSRWRIGEAVATPQFVEEGVWVSRSIHQNVEKIQIVYELPMGTALEVDIRSPDKHVQIPLSRSHRSAGLRRGVYRTEIDLSAQQITVPFRIGLIFRSDRADRSPVVYRIHLIP
ncbi:MAG: hypothetical protein GXO78_02380 [Calditrichaeota bacterium]|nr:hypothetical protein [Calditrichota bacterium]